MRPDGRCYVCGNLSAYCICGKVELVPNITECDHDDYCYDCGTCPDCPEREIEDLRGKLERANALLDAVAADIGGDYLDLLAQQIEEKEGGS